MTLSLVVDATGATLRRHGDHLVVGRESQRLATAPLAGLRDVILVGRVETTSAAVEALLERRIPLVYLGATGRLRGIVLPEALAGLAVRQAQYAAAANPLRRLQIARCIAAGRLQTARTLGLRLTHRHRTPGQRRTLDHIRGAREKALGASTLPELLGWEGRGTRAWFGLMRTLVPAAWEFARRTRRPPLDRVSALLSFGYALVTARCAAAVCAAGLDPALGFAHTPRAGRPALALDLVEQWRAPVVEATVLNMIRRNMVDVDEFRHHNGGVLIDAPARRVLVQQVQRRLDTRVTGPNGQRRLIGTLVVDQAHSLARALRDGADYLPFTTK